MNVSRFKKRVGIGIALICLILIPVAWLIFDPLEDAKPRKRVEIDDPFPAVQERPKGRFTVSRETTYVLGPLDESGRINYVQALVNRLGEVVRPDTNAVVPLWKAIGPIGVGFGYFEVLESEFPPEDGSYFVEYAGPADEYERARRAPWTADGQPTVARWLTANEKPLAVVREAAKREHFFEPLISPLSINGMSGGLLRAELPATHHSVPLAKALAIRALLRLREDKLDEAWTDLIAAFRLARLVGRGGALIAAKAGADLECHLADAASAFLDRATDSNAIESWGRDLQSLPPLPDVANCVETDRLIVLDVVMLVDRYGFDYLARDVKLLLNDISLDGIDWDPALRGVNEWHDRFAAALREKPRSLRREHYNRVADDLKAMLARASDRNQTAQRLRDANNSGAMRGRIVGEVLVGKIMPAADLVQDAVDRARQTHENLLLAFALARYRLEHKAYPAELQALSPKYIDRIPEDLFSGKPLIYRPEKDECLLYSVGLNGSDDGGRSEGDVPKGDDLVVRMPRKSPR